MEEFLWDILHCTAPGLADIWPGQYELQQFGGRWLSRNFRSMCARTVTFSETIGKGFSFQGKVYVANEDSDS